MSRTLNKYAQQNQDFIILSKFIIHQNVSNIYLLGWPI